MWWEMGIWIIHSSPLMPLSWIVKGKRLSMFVLSVNLSTRRLVHPLIATDLPTRERDGNQ